MIFQTTPIKQIYWKLRIALSRQISENISNKNKEIYAYEIDKDTLDILAKQTDSDENNIKIELNKFSKFKKILKENKEDIISQNAVLVAPSQFRQIIFILVSQLLIDIPVVCYEK